MEREKGVTDHAGLEKYKVYSKRSGCPKPLALSYL
jgi:hypothetical protein